jgi:translation elongation factor EF-4
VCGLDPSTEPFPMVGRSPRSDVVNLVGYISELLRRASAGSGRGVEAVVDSVVAELPVPEDQALGA